MYTELLCGDSVLNEPYFICSNNSESNRNAQLKHCQ